MTSLGTKKRMKWLSVAKDDTFWVPDDIESCNFQNLLIFRFHETSQNLMSFRQLLFSLFHGKNLKTQKSVKCQASISENPVPLLNIKGKLSPEMM